MNRTLTLLAVVATALALPAAALAGHGLSYDHAPPSFGAQQEPAKTFTSGGKGAKWELLASFPTANPHTDLDFFTKNGETYGSFGTLGIGANGGGQEILQLTEGGKVAPKRVSFHPSANCVSNPAEALGLQHDVEATPKGNAILNTDVLDAARTDTQLLIDATDAPGRCHDQGVLGIEQAPQGGLEIIDVTDPTKPKEIGLTSHIGEAHTVNVDPRRPHIAYAVTSDSVSVDAQGKRANETAGSAALNLDGFEVVNLASCMNFPAGTTLEQKRAQCRPEVFRYRYPTVDMALGHTNKNSVYGCHELEVYPDDRLICGGGNALIALNMSGAFDDNGTPRNYLDDKPRGTPLPCSLRDSTTVGGFDTGAKITDCRDGQGAGENDLRVAEWLAAGAPSLTGVTWLGSAFHPGRESATGAASPKFDSTQDIDFNHEAELTHSGDFLLATDERGGGVAPPGASCSTASDVKVGNGGVHAYRTANLLRRQANLRRGRPQLLRRPSPGAGRRSTAPRSATRLRWRCAPPTCSSRSRARTGSSWAGTRRGPRCSTTRSATTARSTSRRRPTSSPPTRTSGSRTCSRSSATATAASPTTGPPRTSRSATADATRSTCTR